MADGDTGTQKVTLATLGRGAAEELFARELTEILDNILDENTDAEAKRALILTITLEPNEDRRQAAITIACSSKLAPVRPAPSTFFFGRRGGKAVAAEYHPTQESLFGPSGQKIIQLVGGGKVDPATGEVVG